MALFVTFMLAFINQWTTKRLPLLLITKSKLQDIDNSQAPKRRLYAMLITGLRTLISTFLMLLLMSFNAWILLASMLGAMIGQLRYYEDFTAAELGHELVYNALDDSRSLEPSDCC